MKIKGRGAQQHLENRFDKQKTDYQATDGIDESTEFSAKTSFLNIYPKSILNKVDSPDVPMPLSLNPYQGCEHGCVYCYARNSHEFWGYNAGLDFEQKIMIKQNAVELLIKTFKSKNYEPQPIMLSGNTDCYQPIEREKKLTRSILETCLRYKNPIGIITKNALIRRDSDVLSEMAKLNLIQVVISFTSIHNSTRSLLEPRTSSVENKLKTIREFSEMGIPVMVLMAPIIPFINSDEILELAKQVSNAGALGFGHQVVRLNGQLEGIFEDWLQIHYPERRQRVMNTIREIHGGTIQDNRFGTRMKGEGSFAKQISDLMKIAKRKYFANRQLPDLRSDLFDASCDDQQTKLDLFY